MQDKLFTRIFENIVAHQPEATAYFTEKGTLSYNQLNNKANLIADNLLEMGVIAKDRVALYMDNSSDLAAAMLGVQKIGTTCVPFDLLDSKGRLQYYVNDCAPKIVLSNSSEAFKYSGQAKQLFVDELLEEQAKLTFSNPSFSPHQDFPSFIFYTSGTTGRPKGVVQSQSMMLHAYQWLSNYLKFTKNDCGISKIPTNLMGYRGETIALLMDGGSVVLVENHLRQDIHHLVALIKRYRVTFLRMTPSMLRVFLASKELNNCDSLRVICCSGESMSQELERQFLEQHKSIELHLFYGATEAGSASYRKCIPHRRNDTYSIGKPTDGTIIKILSPELEEVAPGMQGEIFIGGKILADGYWDLPELTNEKFIQDPDSDSNNHKLYRTGDYGKFLDDGNIAFLGRKDFRGNLRGVKIDYSEIENAINQHSKIESSVVSVKGVESEHQRLIAHYILSSRGDSPSPSGLVQFLSERLHQSLIPNCFMEVDSFPISKSGKIDRESLPDPLLQEGKQKSQIRPSIFHLEGRIAKIWKNILRLNFLPNVDDRFSHLGGSSIAALELIIQLEDEFGIKVPLKDILENDTISLQSKLVESSILTYPDQIKREELGNSENSPVRENDFPFSIQILNVGSQNIPIICCGAYSEIAKHFIDHPVYALDAGVGKISASQFQSLANFYVGEVMKMLDQTTVVIIGYSLGCEIAMRIAQRMNSMGYEIPSLILIDHPVIQHYEGKTLMLFADKGPYIELKEIIGYKSAIGRYFPSGLEFQVLIGDHASVVQNTQKSGLLRMIENCLLSSSKDLEKRDCDTSHHTGDPNSDKRSSILKNPTTANTPDEWAQSGWNSMENGDFKHGACAYEKALKQRSNFDWYFHLAQCYESLGRYNEAIKNWKNCTHLRPKSSGALLNLAWALFHQKEYEESIKTCRNARGLDPYFLDIYFVEYMCYREIGNDEQRSFLLSFVNENTEKMVFDENRISVLWYMDKPESGTQHFNYESLRYLTEKYSIQLYRSAWRHKRLGNSEEAVRMLKKLQRQTKLTGLLRKSKMHLFQMRELD